MAKRPIRLYGDPVLRASSRPVDARGPETRALVGDLFDTLHEARGIGLAAPQIGVPARVCVVDLAAVESGSEPLALINPEVLERGAAVSGEEGCLSFPGLFIEVERSEVTRLRYQTVDGQFREVSARGLQARVLLHECDHLDGVLFIDHLTRSRRVLLARRLRQLRRRQKRGETA